MAKRFLIYGHGGCYNHGGEALVRCGIEILRQRFPGCYIILSSHFPEQDREFGLSADEIIGCDKKYFAFERENNYSIENNDQIYQATIKCITPETICIHLGGDNYCYDSWRRYANIHYRALEIGAKSVLWSCSIDPDRMCEDMLNALRSHHLIAAREGITYQALKQHGISQVIKVSDLAFRLVPTPVSFPFSNYVSITFGPLAVKKEKKQGLAFCAFQKLVDYILLHTDMNIALVPHVIMPTDNDYEMMAKLNQLDPQRIHLVAEHYSAAQLKHIIGNARFCVTLRTHASIAAYSSCVPTLVIGYSMKSTGIANDLGVLDHVLQLENLDNDNQIVEAFAKMVSAEDKIIKLLKKTMPRYMDEAVNNQMFSFGGI